MVHVVHVVRVVRVVHVVHVVLPSLHLLCKYQGLNHQDKLQLKLQNMFARIVFY